MNNEQIWDRIRKIRHEAYMDAIGCGETLDFAEKYASQKVAHLVAAQKKKEALGEPCKIIYRSNQAGIRQAAQRKAEQSYRK